MAKHQGIRFCAIYTDSDVSSYGLSLKYKDGYKVTIMSKSYEELKDIFFSLISVYDVSTRVYIEVTALEALIKKIVDELKMKEYSRKSRMYNKLL